MKENDIVYFVVTGNVAVSWVAAETACKAVSNGFLREMAMVHQGDNIGKYRVASMILSGNEVFRKWSKRAQVGRASVHGSIDVHWQSIHIGPCFVPYFEALDTLNRILTSGDYMISFEAPKAYVGEGGGSMGFVVTENVGS